MAAKQVQWSDIKRTLKGLDRNSLLGLVKDLFGLSEENRTFLSARFVPAGKGGRTPIDGFRERIEKEFFPGPGKFGDGKVAPVRKAVREFWKATADARGTLDLTLHGVEQGTAFTSDFGDTDGPFYAGLCALLDEFDKLLRQRDHRVLYPLFAERLRQLREDADGIGWGYGDFVADIVERLEEDLESTSPLGEPPGG
jgi:hypothetical protein